MRKTMLYKLKRGETAVVTGIFAQKRVKTRLGEMGIIRGTRATCLFESPLGGAKAYLVRGTRVAIGQGEAEKIFVLRENR